jgi:hypothetical protein
MSKKATTTDKVPDLSADFENIIYRAFPLKDGDLVAHLEQIKHAADECQKWIEHVNVYGK